MLKPKVSVCVITKNEEQHILLLLFGLAKQTYPIDEIIIVDGFSTDRTVPLIKKFSRAFPKLNIKLVSKKTNISQARNLAVSTAKNNLIASIDAGCLPMFNWLENLIEHYQQTKSPVVAGFYFGMPRTSFEQAVVPYVLVMPDKLNLDTFLPATRSMLFVKKVWQEIGGFNERLVVSEDLDFARKIRSQKIPISVEPLALVGWIPRSNLSSFIRMIYQFAYFDIQASIYRPKVFLIFVRYFLGIFISLVAYFLLGLETAILATIVMVSIYSWWAVIKNVKYVPKGWWWLPVLQISSDVAVMSATNQSFLDFNQRKSSLVKKVIPKK